MKIKKRAALILALFIFITPCLISCKNKLESTKEDKKIIMTIGGFDVPYEVYRYVTINCRRDMENEYGNTIWTEDKSGEVLEELKNNIEQYLRNMYAICSLAQDYDIDPDGNAIMSLAEAEKKKFIDELGGEDEYVEALSSYAMNDSVYLFVTSNEMLGDEIFYAMLDSGEINTDEDYIRSLVSGDQFVRVKQILVSSSNGKSDDENMKLAEQICSRAKEGENFEKLLSEYNDDTFMFSNEDGYYMMRGVRYEQFEDAAFSLEIGEVSDVIESEAGYSIIKRYEKDEEYIESHLDELAESYSDSIYSLAKENRASELEIATTDLFDSYNVLTIN